jgi:predicted nucleic acid-binding Zn ribbon protein
LRRTDHHTGVTDVGACVRCGAALSERQRYCLDCGERIATRKRRVHWVVPAGVAAIVAAGSAAVAVAAGSEDAPPSAIVALSPLRPAPDLGAAGQDDIRSWPRRDGATVVLGLIPTTAPESVAVGRARRALRAGLEDVGILRSDDFASLHPGYRVVFAGVHPELGDALAALPRARATFRSAYAQEITR